jgi:threonine dehydrogenase-like Zn-dependent dehydrogenase
MADIQARAFWIREPGVGEIRAERVPDAKDGEVRIRALYSGISRGTETLVYRGGVPAAEHTRMRAPFQSGRFPGPVKYGYSSVGIIEQGSAEQIGETVFCLYPHQTQYVVPESAAHPLPDDVPAERAVLAANMETAINGLWDAAPAPGSRLTVIGAGAVGCMIAWLAAEHAHLQVELIDIDSSKRTTTDALGLKLTSPQMATDGATTIIHTSGSADGLRTALRLAAFEATIVEMSWYGDRDVCLPLGESFHSQRLILRSSQVGAVAAAKRDSWTRAQRLAHAIDLLREPRLDALITGEDKFESLPAVMARLSVPEKATVCHRIKYD